MYERGRPGSDFRKNGQRLFGPVVGKPGEVPLCVECGLAATASGRDDLAVGVVDDIVGGEGTGDVGARGGRDDLAVGRSAVRVPPA